MFFIFLTSCARKNDFCVSEAKAELAKRITLTPETAMLVPFNYDEDLSLTWTNSFELPKPNQTLIPDVVDWLPIGGSNQLLTEQCTNKRGKVNNFFPM